MRGERLFTGYRKIDKGWVAYRCNVAELDANRDTDLVWVANDDVIQSVAIQSRAQGTAMTARKDPVAYRIARKIADCVYHPHMNEHGPFAESIQDMIRRYGDKRAAEERAEIIALLLGVPVWKRDYVVNAIRARGK